MYDVEIAGLQQQLRLINESGAIADRHLETAMNRAVTTIVSEVRPLVPVGVSGALRQSIVSEVVREGVLSIVGKVGSNLSDEEYPAVMEFGRAPGAAPPPADAPSLVRWVQLKLGPDVPVYPIARSIGERGIRGRFFMRQGFEKAQARVLGYFREALDQIANALRVK